MVHTWLCSNVGMHQPERTTVQNGNLYFLSQHLSNTAKCNFQFQYRICLETVEAVRLEVHNDSHHSKSSNDTQPQKILWKWTTCKIQWCIIFLIAFVRKTDSDGCLPEADSQTDCTVFQAGFLLPICIPGQAIHLMSSVKFQVWEEQNWKDNWVPEDCQWRKTSMPQTSCWESNTMQS